MCRLYWSNLGVVESSDLLGQQREMLQTRSFDIYGLSLFKVSQWWLEAPVWVDGVSIVLVYIVLVYVR